MEKLIDYINTHWDDTLRYTPSDDGDIIGIPYRFTSPSIGKLHSALFYWDTYFTNEGLILSDKIGYAIDNIENIAYLINKFGYMPNGNRTYFLNRSQPPFFSLMVKRMYSITKDKEWLLRMFSAMETEWNFWQEQRQTPIGLNRYYHAMGDIETEPLIEKIELERRIPFFKNYDRQSLYNITAFYKIVCESGWDCNSRMGLNNTNYAWIDLNSLLYGMERDMAYFAEDLGRDSSVWRERCEARKALVNEYLWNEERKMFCDYDFAKGKKSDFLSVAAYYPLFTGLADAEQAAAMVQKVCLLDFEYGVAACEKRDDLFGFQWDYPTGWAPLNYIMIKGLCDYGYTHIAKVIAEKYCALVERAFEKTGDVWEKYDIETGKPAAREGVEHRMMGWSAGIYLWCKSFLR